jgi:hypothetical protein
LDGSVRYRYAGAKADIIVPPGFELIPPAPSQTKYDFGMRNKSLGYEVRVRFDPPMGTQAEYRACRERNKAKPGTCAMADPDLKDDTVAHMFRMNLTGGHEGKMAYFPDEAVKREFGADWGLASDAFSDIDDVGFKAGYQICQFMQLHRSGVGTLLVFHMADSPEMRTAHMREFFHLVKFRD